MTETILSSVSHLDCLGKSWNIHSSDPAFHFFNIQLSKETFQNAVVVCSDKGSHFQFISDVAGAMMDQIFSCEQ